MVTQHDLMDVMGHEHLEMTKLFDELTAIDSYDVLGRAAVFERLSDALVVHVETEQDVLCPVLKAHAATTDLADEALSDHANVRRMLEELHLLEPDGDRWMERVYDLRDLVEHHVVQEERELFARARDLFSEEQLADLGRQFLAHRQMHRVV